MPRTELIERCVDLSVGNPEKGGNFFTIWAPRQAGKTWLMRQAQKEITKRHADRFAIHAMSMQGIIMTESEPAEAFLHRIPLLFMQYFDRDVETPENWESLGYLFSKRSGTFEMPMILFIDEFDKLPPKVIDSLANLFRNMYLDSDLYRIHGLALVGVRAVLGLESDRGSPFNIQRSLPVPNLTKEEVEDMFAQYCDESGRTVNTDVIDSVYEATLGQPGLVGWFGELLTEKYKPEGDRPIDMDSWDNVFARACSSEWNNTVLNMIKKARGRYQSNVINLFGHSDVPFRIDSEWCGYLYLNGLIDKVDSLAETGEETEICRFANPFVQRRLYNAFVDDLAGERTPILALEPLDDLSDVFDKPEIDLQALIDRYKKYHERLKAKVVDPWKGMPRRADLQLAEAVGHFDLYAWLRNAIGRRCRVSPEFPTGNGRVDLHLSCGEKKAIIEVKSFVDKSELEHSKEQASKYAKNLSLTFIALVVFVPVEEEYVLNRLSGRSVLDGVEVFVSAIGWI